VTEYRKSVTSTGPQNALLATSTS